MIRPHQFIGLAAATALSVLLAVGLYAGVNSWSAGKVEGAAFLPELAQKINAVSAIEITQGGKKLTLDRVGERWIVRDRGGYPAKSDAARALLVTLAQSQLIEPKTTVKDRLGLLELEDPGTKDAKSRGVRVLDISGKPIADVVLGKARGDAFGSGKGGAYVRRGGETRSWFATGDPKVTSDIKDWIDTKVISTDASKVVRLTIENPGEDALVIEKSPPEIKEEPAKDAKAAPMTPITPPAKPSKYRLAKMPDGQKLKKDVGLDQIVEAFGAIDLEDVRKLDPAATAADKASTMRLETEGGPTITFRLRRDGDASWLSLVATGEGDAKKAADDINARTTGWEFKLPGWKADQLAKRRADLFEAS